MSCAGSFFSKQMPDYYLFLKVKDKVFMPVGSNEGGGILIPNTENVQVVGGAYFTWGEPNLTFIYLCYHCA